MLWGADQPPPASFGPHSFELRILPPPVPPWIGVRVVIVPNPDRGLTLSLTFGGGWDTRTAASPLSESSPQLLPPSSPGREALRKVRGRCGSGERDHKWGRPRRSVSGSDGRSPAITRPGMVLLNRKPRAGSQLRAEGEGSLSVTAQQRAGQPRSGEQRPGPWSPCSLLFFSSGCIPARQGSRRCWKEKPSSY